LGNFNWNTWFAKLGKGLAIVLGATTVIYLSNYLVANPLPQEYVFWGGMLIIVLEQAGNYIKHSFLVE